MVSETTDITAMAFDWDSRNMYWASTTPASIKVMSLDASHRYTRNLTVNETFLHKVVSMAVDARKGYLYYAGM